MNYTYDDAGRLETINNSSANLTLGYDKAHRLTSVTTGGAMPGTTISYEYYKNDRRKKMTDVIGVANYTPPTLTDPNEYLVSPNMGTFTFSYDNLNRRNNMTMGNGITATYSYDDASQLESIAFKNGAVTVTSNQYPLYDDVGNRKTEVDNSGTHGYDYDTLYRLTSVTHPAGNPNESFTYDSVGNRETSHLSTSYTTDELNRLKEDNSFLYGYDADGNLISKKNKSTNETTYFYFDAENKLIGVDKYNSSNQLISAVDYFYDGFGRRVKKDVNGVVMFYVYDNEDIRFETDGTGAITAEYTHGQGIDEPLAMRRGGANYYYHVNGLGGVIALTNSSKTVVQSYVYDSFGQIISQTGSIQNPYTYTAREYDSETGMYYYRARYYDAKAGRFISEDRVNLASLQLPLPLFMAPSYRDITSKINEEALKKFLLKYSQFYPETLNRYTFVFNNPIEYVDPTGDFLWKPIIEKIFKWWLKKLAKKSVGELYDEDLVDPYEMDDDGDGIINMNDPDSKYCLLNCDPKCWMTK